MSMLKKTIFLVILLSFVFINTILFNGCGDDWVEVGGTEDYTLYYKPSSVNIDINNKTIDVLTKSILSEKGLKNQIGLMRDLEKMVTDLKFDQDYYNNLGYTSFSYVFNYKEWKYTIIQTTSYSKSGDVLSNKEVLPEWYKIEPNTIQVLLLRQLIRKYNIKM